MRLSANPAARAALTYITIGALTDVWAAIWFWYMRSNQSSDQNGTWWYICIGLLLTGAVLMVIGFLVGRIGREARHADAPPAPAGVTQQAAAAQAASAMNQVALDANANGTPQYVAPAAAVPGTVPVTAPFVPVTARPNR
jgi:hypothetical protein